MWSVIKTLPLRSRQNDRPPNSAEFYGWFVLAGAAVSLFFVQGARAVIGVMFKPILNELLWSRSDISLAILLNAVVCALFIKEKRHTLGVF